MFGSATLQMTSRSYFFLHLRSKKWPIPFGASLGELLFEEVFDRASLKNRETRAKTPQEMVLTLSLGCSIEDLNWRSTGKKKVVATCHGSCVLEPYLYGLRTHPLFGHVEQAFTSTGHTLVK
jgi:hypothetical protein